MAKIIVGSGGFAEEFLFWTEGTSLEGKIDGYLGFYNERMPIPYMGEFDAYPVSKDDEFFIAIGHLEYRQTAIEKIVSKGGQFSTFIHPTAVIAKTSSIGQGVIIGPFCLISVNATIGDFCFINNYASVAHHSKLESFVVLNPYASVTGNCVLKEHSQMGTQSSILPKVNVGSRAKIAPGSCAYSNVKEDTVVIGVPAKVLRGI